METAGHNQEYNIILSNYVVIDRTEISNNQLTAESPTDLAPLPFLPPTLDKLDSTNTQGTSLYPNSPSERLKTLI